METIMSDLLEVNGISKHYKSFALQDISFSLPAGYIMGYIGQNGAGKTTTLNAITHLIHTDSGQVTIGGSSFDDDPVAYRDQIGYIGDSSYFPQELNLKNIRTILKDFYPSFHPEIFDRYVKQWQLPAKEKIKTYSRGMKVKLMFASVLSRDTTLLVLDEATNGLDPVMRREILSLLQDYISDGHHSVLFSTHILEDLEQIADYIFFIDQGKKRFCEMKEDLLERYLLVRGGLSDLTPAMEQLLIGATRNEFGFEALYDTDRDALLPASLVTARPSIDQIIFHMVQKTKEETV
jgi:ABC-2 type transport system ATP-binding protein